MITLKKLNIEKIVSTQNEADKLISKGYAVTGGDDDDTKGKPKGKNQNGTQGGA